jgi:hypothetical protein
MPERSDKGRETIELPNGEVVTPEDVFLYENYPYRVQFPDRDGSAAEEPGAENPDYEFELSPLYWGGTELDIPFRDREALVEQWGSESRGTLTEMEWEQWGSESRGTLTEMEWEQWLREARHDDRFGDEELDALARELPVSRGLVARIRDVLRF